MDESPRHIVAVMGVVSDADGRILLVCGARRGWEPPGGQVERGEDLITALRREIAEESGCQVDVGQLVGVYSNTGPLGIVMCTFLCAHTGGEPCGGHECLDAGWFAPDEALRLVTHPAQAAKLRDALAAGDAPGVVYRVYAPRQSARGTNGATRAMRLSPSGAADAHICAEIWPLAASSPRRSAPPRSGKARLTGDTTSGMIAL